MKLVQKLAAALVFGTFLILAANGYLRVEREVAVLRADRERDLDVMGRALAAATAAVWRSEGRARAMAMVEATNHEGAGAHVRWVTADGGADLHVDARLVADLAAGQSLSRIDDSKQGPGARFTYVPVEVDGVRHGALELTESLAPERYRVHTIVVDTVIMTASLVFVSGALSSLLGLWLVGRPVRALAQKAQRIGQGDFSGPIALRSHDELNDLATEMNAMCARLLDAHERAAHEEAARIAALEQLRHADRLMTVGKLASGIAHELGTPLNVVSARASMIAAGDAEGDDARAYAKVIHEAASRMTRIIRQLLEFARRPAAQRAMSDVRAITRDTLELLRALAEKRSVTLTLEAIAPDDGADSGTQATAASVDASQIQQVVTNLVVNAIQAMPDGGRVSVSVSRARAAPAANHGAADAEYLRIRVEDEGRGISAADLPHVFEPFFTTKDVGEGTGLGLSVTYGIVQEHGGFVEVESRVNEGSIFSVYLPLPLAPSRHEAP
jgi:two-component system NtrC family sensor kinase